MNALPIPAAVHADPSARELLRAWAASGAQHVSLAAGVWADPAAWGLFLVDVARHVANAYAQAEGRDAAQVMGRIREALDAEWDAPTDEATGRLV